MEKFPAVVLARSRARSCLHRAWAVRTSNVGAIALTARAGERVGLRHPVCVAEAYDGEALVRVSDQLGLVAARPPAVFQRGRAAPAGTRALTIPGGPRAAYTARVTDYLVKQAGTHLVLASWSGSLDEDAALLFRSRVGDAIARARPAVICADWRAAETVSPGASEVLLSMLRNAHPHLARSAIVLHAGHAMFTLQAERLVKEAGFANRRTFRIATDAVAWLAEILPATELEAAKRFLLGGFTAGSLSA